jgi:hypothetical protein
MNISRFSLTGNQPKSQTPPSVGTPPSAKSSSSNNFFGSSKVNLTSSSMNIPGIKFSNITNITKKVSEGFGNIPNLGTSSAHQDQQNQDRRMKEEEKGNNKRKEQMTQVMNILEDVNLQCPSNHSGLIIAYTGKNMAPIISPGIKFTWFRMKGEESVEPIEMGTSNSWYSPSIDDIGSMICVQCEDNYDQGFSKYLEVRNTLCFSSYIYLLNCISS